MRDGAVQILVVGDELEVGAYYEVAFRCLGYQSELVQDGSEAMNYLRTRAADIGALLLSLEGPNHDSIGTLREIRRLYPNLPVIMVSGAPSPLHIVTAMKNGATDFLCQPVTHEDLRKAITRALEVNVGERLRPAKSTAAGSRVFLGKSPRMQAVQSVLKQVGWSEEPVLIQGETGSGKEMIARELHAYSPRAKKPFIKLNCAALPSELVESELFGYERGAFTGAFQRKQGMFEMADGGTLLLDEIGDMDVRLQAKLLQVLQDHEFQRIGGKDTIRVDVRVIAATHRDLEKAIREREFREDLYYRLNVVNLEAPPLRERKEDIVGLAEFLLKRHAPAGAAVPPVTAELRAAMLAWDWPGNVRELENFARKLLVFQDPGAAARELRERATHRSAVTSTWPEASNSSEPGAIPILEQVTKAKQHAEADAILDALKATRWNRKQASALLQIDYKALLYKMKKLGLDDKSSGEGEDPPAAIMAAGSL